MLIEARTGTQPPELDKALAETRQLLSDPQLPDSERPAALLQEANILVLMNRPQESTAVLGKIPDTRPLRGEISLLKGRVALAEGLALKKVAGGPSPPANDAKRPSSAAPLAKGDASHEKFRLAIELFRKALSQDLDDGHVARQAAYLIGLCLVEEGDLPAALNQMERAARLFPETPESLAALCRQGEIARRIRRHAEAVSAYQRLVSAWSRQEELGSPWISRAEARASLLDACQEYLKAEKYQTAVLLSKSLARFLPPDEALQLTAQVYRTWGDNLMEQADHLPPEKAEELRKVARRAVPPSGRLFPRGGPIAVHDAAISRPGPAQRQRVLRRS